MATGQVGDAVGRHLPTINIMDDTLLTDYTLPEHKSAMDQIVFLPYTFKELKEVNLVEFSAMCAFGIAPYITLLQRNVVPRDLFYWGLFNCDASDERLIITGLNGSATVVGWQELERAFGANHSEDDEFRATKIMQKQLLPYNPNDFLLVFTEKNSNKELVSGKDYEENAAGLKATNEGSVAPSVSAPMATVSSSSNPDTYGSIESVEQFCAVVFAEIQDLLTVKVTDFCAKFAFQEFLLQEKYDALGKEHAVQLGELQAKNQTLTKQVKDLQESNSRVTELKADNERLAVKVTALNYAKEAHGAKIHDLEKHVTNLNNKYNAAANLLKEKDAALKAALAAQTSSKGELKELHRLRVSAGALQRSKVEIEKELSVLKSEKTTATGQLATVTASYNAVKLALDKESHALTEALLRIETLQDEMKTMQFKLEAAENGRTTARQDLATARAQLQQASYLGNASAPQQVPILVH
ncbi:hypothetical protein R1sor_018830 [Riccia sorocarpa]|uniref:Uncharacterized protein n=1 Tax=Riccia sorocarpa TaxID=122646 RepID=A0ABD3IAS9_9MARC